MRRRAGAAGSVLARASPRTRPCPRASASPRPRHGRSRRCRRARAAASSAARCTRSAGRAPARAADRRRLRALPRRVATRPSTSRLARARRRPAAGLARRDRAGARRADELLASRRRARRGGLVRRSNACTCASSSCGRATGTRPRGCSTSGPSRPTRAPALADVRALPRAARRRTRASRRGATLGGARPLAARRARPGVALGPARGAAGARDRSAPRPRAGRAAEHLRAVWEHTSREGVDEPGASRSRRTWSRRSSRSASWTRRAR